MIYKFQYTDNREQIVLDNADKFLIEDQNLFEGKFLIFSDVKLIRPLPPIRTDLEDITILVADLTELVLLGGE